MTTNNEKPAASDLSESAGSMWRPMDTAPKDGSDFLAVVNGARVICRWGKVSHVPIYGWIDLVLSDVEDLDLCDPECWMPLPSLSSNTETRQP